MLSYMQATGNQGQNRYPENLVFVWKFSNLALLLVCKGCYRLLALYTKYKLTTLLLRLEK